MCQYVIVYRLKRIISMLYKSYFYYKWVCSRIENVTANSQQSNIPILIILYVYNILSIPIIIILDIYYILCIHIIIILDINYILSIHIYIYIYNINLILI